MKKFYKALTIVIIALFCLEIPLTVTPVHAVSTTLEIINAVDGTHEFNFTTAQKSVGDTFTVNITVLNVANLSAWQVGIQWNSSLLTYKSLSMTSSSLFPINAKDESQVATGLVIAGGQQAIGATPISGNLTLAQLTLNISQGVSSSGLRQVQCDISFEGLQPNGDTFMLSGLTSIPFTAIIGHYTYTAPPPPPATLFINPPKVVNPTLTAGTQFNVSLDIKSATSVNLWFADILYDNTILNATNVQEGDFLQSVGPTSFNFTIQQDYNGTNGLISVSCSLLSGGTNGNGTLATITFQVLGLGQSAISVTDVILRDPFGLSLPFNTADGYFNNILLAKLSVDPPVVTGPEYVIGSTFTINVTLQEVQDFKTAIFNLTYVPSIVQEIDINIPSVLGQVPIKKVQYDDDAGYIWVNMTFHDGISTINPVTLMTVQFQVLGLGVSPLNLTDTHLYDIGGNPITHEVHHGIFIGIIHHVAVTDVAADLPVAYQGWIVYVNVTVKNEGNATETFDAHFYFDGNLGNTTTVTNLDPDQVRVMLLMWNTSTAQACHNYTILGTVDPVPYQTDLSDVNFTDGKVKIRLMGDVNGDGRVDMKDIAQLVAVFRSSPIKPNWDLLNDLDRNAIVDMHDIAICIMHFNEHCP